MGCTVTIDVTQGGTTKSVNLHLVVEKAVVQDLTKGTQATLQPFDFANLDTELTSDFGLEDLFIPSNIPIIGGGQWGTVWLPTFHYVNVQVNPFGYFQLTAMLGSDDGSGLPTSYGYKNYRDPDEAGWQKVAAPDKSGDCGFLRARRPTHTLV